MKMIVAVDDNWAIGYKGKLLKRIPTDMKRFVDVTIGKIVIMGRKTLESLPEGKPLKDRTNIVMTSDRSYTVDGAIIVHDIEELRKVLYAYNYHNIVVIGGGEIYRLLLPYCDTVYVTKIKSAFRADTFFPALNDEWEIKATSELFETNDGTQYQFIDYVRQKKFINLVQDSLHTVYPL